MVSQEDLLKGPRVDPDALGSQQIVFFSKLDCNMWPCVKTVSEKIAQLMETLNTTGPEVECDFNSL